MCLTVYMARKTRWSHNVTYSRRSLYRQIRKPFGSYLIIINLSLPTTVLLRLPVENIDLQWYFITTYYLQESSKPGAHVSVKKVFVGGLKEHHTEDMLRGKMRSIFHFIGVPTVRSVIPPDWWTWWIEWLLSLSAMIDLKYRMFSPCTLLVHMHKCSVRTIGCQRSCKAI